MQAPPWILSLQQSLDLVHSKMDQAHQQVSALGSDVHHTKKRVGALEDVARHHNATQAAAMTRLDQLEKEVEALRSRGPSPAARGRSPTLVRQGGVGGREVSPAAGRSPRDLDAELQIVIGGWRDARKADAEREASTMLAKAGHEGMLMESWAPYIRTTFLKITLRFPEDMALTTRRQLQNKIVLAAREIKFRRQLEGSEGTELWCTKQRPVEERHKIRALVMCKELIEKLGDKATKRHEIPEIDWRGRLYVGNVQLIGSADRTEPAPEDQFVADNKGNHTSWYVIAAAVEKATGLPASRLQAVWLDVMAS